MQDDSKFPLGIEVGSTWCWEPLNPEQTCRIKVADTHWSGQEWYVQVEALEDAGHMWKGMKNWYYLNHFIEVSVLTGPSKRFMER